MNDVNAIFAERVKNGATFLDSEIPGWYNKINTETLKINSPCNHVLGQVGNHIGSSYEELIDELGIGFRDRQSFGFTILKADLNNKRFDILTSIWKREIKKRRLLDEIKLIQEKECVNA